MDHVTEHCSSDGLGGIDRVILVHGFGAGPHDHWFPWLARTVPHVEVPQLPHPETPDASAWASTIAERIGTSPDGLTGLAIVTHSLGGLTALRAIERVIACDSPANGNGRHLAAFIAVAGALAAAFAAARFELPFGWALAVSCAVAPVYAVGTALAYRSAARRAFCRALRRKA